MMKRLAFWTFTAQAAVGGVAIFFGQLGRWLEVFDLANLLLPVWLALAGIGLIGNVAIRRKGLSSWFAVATLGMMGLAMLQLQIMPSSIIPAAGDDPEIRLKIVSFNLWKDNRQPRLAARWIREQKPDIVVLTEAAGKSRGIPAMLSDVQPFRQQCHSNGHCSTLILSRISPDRSVALGTGDVENRKGLSAALIGWNEKFGGATVLGVHLARPYAFDSAGGVTDLDHAIGGGR